MYDRGLYPTDDYDELCSRVCIRYTLVNPPMYGDIADNNKIL